MSPPLYCVFGHPIQHSRSPRIHAAFAASLGLALDYQARLAPVDGFAGALANFRAAGGLGCNVTVPFKEQAFALAQHVHPRAAAARAANTLWWGNEGLHADNTDGVGLICDLRHHDVTLTGARVLLLGAGGAARGVIGPLLEQPGLTLTLANRTHEKALALAQSFADTDVSASPRIEAARFAELGQHAFDVVINATSAGLSETAFTWPVNPFAQTGAQHAVAYDMVYGKPTPFLQASAALGAQPIDGLGMLVEQAAAAFTLWHGQTPDTAPVLKALRAELAGQR